MSYISYFDLLGTRGFCEEPNIYYDNIVKFYEIVQQVSCLLKDDQESGGVAIFSDCAYAQSSSLNRLLSFVVGVRDRLMAQGLFFNAAIKKGNLGISSIESSNKSRPAIGVIFKDSQIASLYILQSQFKGIGIFIDRELIDEVNQNTDFKTSKCFFLEETFELGNKIILPKVYYDVKLRNNSYTKEIEHTLDILYRNFYSAYIKSPHFGMYYVSILCNFLRSSDNIFEWDYKKKTFSIQPLEFKSIWTMLKNNSITDLPGIEYLALIMVDVVYSSNISTDIMVLKNFTQDLLQIESVERKFIHSLNNLPRDLFSEGNRERFIRYCQDYLSSSFVERVFEEKKT